MWVGYAYLIHLIIYGVQVMNTIAVIVVAISLLSLFAGTAAVLVAVVLLFPPSKQPAAVLSKEAAKCAYMDSPEQRARDAATLARMNSPEQLARDAATLARMNYNI